MSLISRVRGIEEAAKEYKSLEKVKEHADKTRERTQQISNGRIALEGDIARYRVLVAAEVDVSGWPSFEGLLEALGQFESEIESDPRGGRQEFRILAKGLQRIVGDSGEVVKRAIENCRKSALAAIDPSLIKSYGDLDEHAPTVKDILAARSSLEVANWLELDENDLARILKTSKLAIEKVEAVIESNVPKEVREFFTSAKGRGATIDEFDEVRSWLEDNGHLDRLRVRPVGK